MKTTSLISTALIAVLSTSPLYANENQGNLSPEQRLQRVENMLNSDVLLEQMRGMDALREEVSSLRALIEEQQFALDAIKQRQRSLYLDMDRRLNNLERGAIKTGKSPIGLPNTKQTTTPVVVATPSQGAGSSDAKTAYGKAFELLKEGRYAQSIESFSKFLKDFPKSQYTDNAQYWLAEANYVSREYSVALDEFMKLIAEHPESSKIPGAQLKIGYVHYELKNWADARESLQGVVDSYPDTTVAKKAGERLARMKREGR